MSVVTDYRDLRLLKDDSLPRFHYEDTRKETWHLFSFQFPFRKKKIFTLKYRPASSRSWLRTLWCNLFIHGRKFDAGLQRATRCERLKWLRWTGSLKWWLRTETSLQAVSRWCRLMLHPGPGVKLPQPHCSGFVKAQQPTTQTLCSLKAGPSQRGGSTWHLNGHSKCKTWR